jgi:hypothetical protein
MSDKWKRGIIVRVRTGRTPLGDHLFGHSARNFVSTCNITTSDEAGQAYPFAVSDNIDDSICCFAFRCGAVSRSVAVEVLHFHSPASGTNKI